MDDMNCHDLYLGLIKLLRGLARLDEATRAYQEGAAYVGDIPLPLTAAKYDLKPAIKAAVLAGLTRIETRANSLTSAVLPPGKPDPHQRAELEITPLKIVPLLTDAANNLAVRMQQFEPTEQPDGSDRYTLTPKEEQAVADLIVLLGPGVLALCALLRVRVA